MPCQTKTVSLRGVAGIALIEFIVDMLHRLGSHAAACVLHRDQHPARLRPLAQRHAAAFRRKFDSIGEQIRPHHFQQTRVCINFCTVLQVSFKVEVFLFPNILELHRALAQLGTDIKGFRHRANSANLFHVLQESDHPLRCSRNRF